jgi:hypothetical protein
MARKTKNKKKRKRDHLPTSTYTKRNLEIGNWDWIYIEPGHAKTAKQANKCSSGLLKGLSLTFFRPDSPVESLLNAMKRIASANSDDKVNYDSIRQAISSEREMMEWMVKLDADRWSDLMKLSRERMQEQTAKNQLEKARSK